MEGFLTTADDGVQEVRIGQDAAVRAPTFMPEIKGAEDLQVLAENPVLLDPHAPIFFPASKFSYIRRQSVLEPLAPQIRTLLTKHPKILYDPPEVFRFRMPRDVVQLGLKTDRSSTIRFNRLVREGKHREAVAMLPLFFQPFVASQVAYLHQFVTEEEYVDFDPKDFPTTQGKATDAWADPLVDEGIWEYHLGKVEEAAKWPNTYVCPPVPVITGGASDQTIKRVIGVNRVMASVCKKFNESSDNQVETYLHLYIDITLFTGRNDIDNRLVKMIEKELTSGLRYAGIVLTISGYERAFEQNCWADLESFVGDVVTTARRFVMPVFLPRTGGWYGLRLTDVGVHGFGCMLNSQDRYPPLRKSGGMKEEMRYGNVPLIDVARSLSADDLISYLHKYGEMPKIPGCPGRPPVWNPNGNDLATTFGDPKEFRLRFGKPIRLGTHAEEARRIRRYGVKKGLPDAARRYLERSRHEHFGTE